MFYDKSQQIFKAIHIKCAKFQKTAGFANCKRNRSQSSTAYQFLSLRIATVCSMKYMNNLIYYFGLITKLLFRGTNQPYKIEIDISLLLTY